MYICTCVFSFFSFFSFFVVNKLHHCIWNDSLLSSSTCVYVYTCGMYDIFTGAFTRTHIPGVTISLRNKSGLFFAIYMLSPYHIVLLSLSIVAVLYTCVCLSWLTVSLSMCVFVGLRCCVHLFTNLSFRRLVCLVSVYFSM